jgi:transposase
LSAKLGDSRATLVRFSTHEDSEAWLAGLSEAFAYFCGVPEKVLFDNARTIITERDAYGKGMHRWHLRLAALAEQYGSRPRVYRPYRARTKGEVERFNGYLKGSFITPLAATGNAHIGRWCEEVAHQRIHGTTGEKSARHLAEERLVLLQLPERTTRTTHVPGLRTGRALPHESLQHPLSVYEQLLEVRA